MTIMLECMLITLSIVSIAPCLGQYHNTHNSDGVSCKRQNLVFYHLPRDGFIDSKGGGPECLRFKRSLG